MKHEVIGHVLGKTDALEDSHVLSGGEDIGVLDLCVDVHHLGNDIVFV